MRIGVFDSGLGGLAIARAITARLPQYDYLYLGDTKRVPYGNRSQATIHQFTAEALNYLFANNCHLVVLACNTASAEALRKSQQEYLPQFYPDRRVLGVVIPGAEAATEGGAASVGVIATSSTVESGAYQREILQRCPSAQVHQIAAPLLVPLIENDGLKYIEPVLRDYLSPTEGKLDSLILGCTHYSLIKDQVRAVVDCRVISQDEVIPEKLADYLVRHPEHETKLGQHGERLYRITDITPGYSSFAGRLMGQDLPLEVVEI